MIFEMKRNRVLHLALDIVANTAGRNATQKASSILRTIRSSPPSDWWRRLIMSGYQFRASEASRSPHDLHPVFGKHLVLGHERDLLRLCLCHDQTVEGIAVMKG